MSPAMAQVLDGAADLIEQNGWCQGVYSDAEGRYCVVGAVNVAAQLAGKTRSATPAIRALMSEVGASSPGVWNDAPDRTADEVIVVLRRLAARKARP